MDVEVKTISFDKASLPFGKVKEQYDGWLSHAMGNMWKAREMGEHRLLVVDPFTTNPVKFSLTHEGLPGEQFACVLRGARAYYDEHRRDAPYSAIYVPGTVNPAAGTTKPVSLSDAGCNYLCNSGVSPTLAFGNEINERYGTEAGVLNANDAAFVATTMFADYGFAELHLFCTADQVFRNVLAYLQMGVMPELHVVEYSTGGITAGAMDQIFRELPKLLSAYEAATDGDDDAVHLRDSAYHSIYEAACAERRKPGHYDYGLLLYSEVMGH